MADEYIELNFSEDIEKRFNELSADFNKIQTMQTKAEAELQSYKLNNLQKYYDEIVNNLNKVEKENIDRENRLKAARQGALAENEKAQKDSIKRLLNFAETHKSDLSFTFTEEELEEAINNETKLAELKAKLDNKAAEDAFQKAIDNIHALQDEKEKVANKAEKQEQKKLAKERKEKVKQQAEDAKKLLKSGDIVGALAAAKKWLNPYTAKDFTDENGASIVTKKNGEVVDAETVAKRANTLNAISEISSGLANLALRLDKQVDEIAGYKSFFDTRLQGSRINDTFMGSYWQRMSLDIAGSAGVSPLIRQETVVKNLQTMVDKGISFNVEQRAFLETLKEKIATTFDANNGTLLRLVRIQQADSTAARLGMESMMTTFLNGMFENTEYLKDVATSVKSSLEESMAMMSAVDAVGFEYQVQKWMGSLYSVGMSQQSVQSIADAFGKLAAGDISALGSDGAGNLIVMAANKANLSIADMLASGLDESDTNRLLGAVIDYLGEISEQTADSHVVRQQMAKVFGMKGSDLVAATNLMSSRNTIYNSSSNYSRSMQQLYNMAGSMASRTSTGELMKNMWDNFNYTTASGIASNPATYSIFKIGKLLKDTVGGIEFGIPLVMGSGLAQTFNVADLMLTGALSGGLLAGLGSMIAGGGGGGLTGKGMLKSLGINQNSITTLSRGNFAGTGGITSGMTVSESGMVGNASSEDIVGSTMSSTTSEQQARVEAAEADHQEVTLSDVNENVVKIATLLEKLSDDTSLHVHVDNISESTFSRPENVLGSTL